MKKKKSLAILLTMGAYVFAFLGLTAKSSIDILWFIPMAFCFYYGFIEAIKL